MLSYFHKVGRARVKFQRNQWQETPGVTGKFGLGVQTEAGQRLIEFCQENTLVIADALFQQHKIFYTWFLLSFDNYE